MRFFINKMHRNLYIDYFRHISIELQRYNLLSSIKLSPASRLNYSFFLKQPSKSWTTVRGLLNTICTSKTHKETQQKKIIDHRKKMWKGIKILYWTMTSFEALSPYITRSLRFERRTEKLIIKICCCCCFFFVNFKNVKI